MLCNNTQFYEWHPVFPMRGWTFALRVGCKGYEVVGGHFKPGAKWTKRQMRQLKRDARKTSKAKRREVEKLQHINDTRFQHDGFPYQLLHHTHRPKVVNAKVRAEDVPAMIAAGYRRVSNSGLHISRIDRPDWRKYMAYQHAPWDPAGQGMEWANSGDMADHYRRCYSPDIIVLADEQIYRMFPGSGWSRDEYVEAKIIKGIAYAI